MGIRSFVNNYKNMPGNVRVNVSVLPLWSIPFNLVNSYASLYMLNQGITASKIGLINSISFILKTFFALFAGYVVNKFGRRKSVGTLDLIGWAFTMLIYSFATNFWQFMLAAVINCITIINNVANTCFLVEDVENEQRIKAFYYFGMVGSLCTLFAPISGILISKFTLIPAMRILYFFAFCSMLAASLCKLFFLKETSVGREMMRNSNISLNPFAGIPKQVVYILKNSRLILLFSMNILVNFVLTINGLFYFPFLTKALHFSETIISFFPFITTTVTLFVYFYIVPRIRNMGKGLLTSIFLYCAGALMMIIASYTLKEIAYISIILWAIASSTMSPVLNTMIANSLENEMRTEVIGFFNVFSMLCMFPAGYIGGALFEVSPKLLIYFMFSVYFISYLLFSILVKKEFEPKKI